MTVQIRDLFREIPLSALVVTGGAAAMARDAQGIYNLNLSGASTTYNVFVPFAELIKESLHGGSGTMIRDLVIAYAPLVADLTAAPTVTFITEDSLRDAVARAVNITPLGAVTYERPIGTSVASLPVTATAGATTMYVARAIPATPAFETDIRAFIGAEVVFATGAGATNRIGRVGVHIARDLVG